MLFLNKRFLGSVALASLMATGAAADRLKVVTTFTVLADMTQKGLIR